MGCKEAFKMHLPPTLKISPDYQPKEQFHPEGKGERAGER